MNWTDPTASDLSNVRIYRIKNEEAAVSLSVLGKGVKTYTDSAVVDGDVVKYAISSLDLTGNESSKSSYVQVTVTTGAQGEVVVVTEEEETPAAETPADDSEVVAEPVVVTTESGETVTLTDISTHWSAEPVTAMVEKGIVKGYEDGTFKPQNNLTRAEGSALLYRVLGFAEPEAPTVKPFNDITDLSSWYAGYLAKLKELSLIKGYDDGTFKPTTQITRAEFLKLAMDAYKYVAEQSVKDEILGYEEGETTSTYVDVTANNWYAPTVTAATELGFVGGKTCQTDKKCFDGSANITRAEATKILYEMFYTLLE
ncbi:MAG: S-layer homology domain-containing protein [Candidatus Gracilibacteria bacterium]